MEIVPIANNFGYFNHLRFFGDIIDSRQSQINLFIYLLFSDDKLQKEKYYLRPIRAKAEFCYSVTKNFVKNLREKPNPAACRNFGLSLQ